MCGILAIATVRGTALPFGDAEAIAMRDAMAHRGPDGAGVWWSGDRSVCLGHRRLAVRGLEGSANQPMVLKGGVNGSLSLDHFDQSSGGGEGFGCDDALVLIYNGEWYSEPTARRALQRRGVTLRTGSDTETLLRMMALQGDSVLDGLRGMFGLVIYDGDRSTLTIARDPLGIKPVYWARVAWKGLEQVVVASEPTALLKHPGMSAQPDWAMVSSYISHSRAALGDRSMFRGIHALLPGEVITFQLSGQRITERRRMISLAASRDAEHAITDRTEAERAIRRAVRDSTLRHLLSDVPTCVLLSGGLDSTVLTLIARERMSDLRTFAAGDQRDLEDTKLDETGDDLGVAAQVAEAFGLRHDQAVLDGEAWMSGWRSMVDELGVPMSTPNEVAIYGVAKLLRGQGCVVTLSGEGADELMLGYSGPLNAIKAGVVDGRAKRDPAGFAMEISTWISGEHKAMLLREEFWQAAEADVFRRIAFERALEDSAGWFSGGSRDAGSGSFANQAGALARLNLNALLRRLDTATMLAGVEGRTPFADCRVAETALGIAAKLHFDALTPGPMQTKQVLRRAFRDDVPSVVMKRAKASFPLPFQRWMAEAGVGEAVRHSEFLRSIYHDEAIEAVAENPYGNWMLAWPMVNLMAWAQRWGWESRKFAGGVRAEVVG